MFWQLNWTRGLWLWSGALGLFLVCAILPLPFAARLWLVAVILIVVGLGWMIAGRQDKARSPLVLADGCVLPAADFSLPVVAVCGDDLATLFGDVAEGRLALRVTAQGCYLRVASLDQLPLVIEQVLASRPHWNGQVGVFLVVNPVTQQDPALLAGNLRAFRTQIARLRRGGLELPVVLGSYLPSAPRTYLASSLPWHCWLPEAAPPRRHPPRPVAAVSTPSTTPTGPLTASA